MSECIFCKIVKGEIPCAKILEDDRVLSFVDINPINPGHAGDPQEALPDAF